MSMNALRYLLPNANNSPIWISGILMILGIYILGWKPEIVIFSYIFETIVIGILHVFKMFAVVIYSEKEQRERKFQNSSKIMGIFTILFFCVHYFFFIALQSVFVFVFVGMNNSNFSSDFTAIFQNFGYLFSQSDMREAFTLIIANNVIYVFRSFFIPKIYLEKTVKELFFQPYLRVFVQQFVVILGGFIFMFLGNAKGIAVLVVIFKTFVDLIGISMNSNSQFKEITIRFLLNSSREKLSTKEFEEHRKFIEKMFE